MTGEFAILGAEQSYSVSDLPVLSTSCQQGCSCHRPRARENMELRLPCTPQRKCQQADVADTHGRDKQQVPGGTEAALYSAPEAGIDLPAAN